MSTESNQLLNSLKDKFSNLPPIDEPKGAKPEISDISEEEQALNPEAVITEEKKIIDPVLEDEQDSEQEEEGEEEEQQESSALSQVYEALGEEEGIDLSSYGGDLNGLINLNKDLTKVKSEKLAVNIFKQTLESSPDLANFYKHVVLEGKSKESFFIKNTQPDFDKIDISKEEGQKQMIKSYYKELKGLSDEDAEGMIDLHENRGSLEKIALSAKQERLALRQEEVKRMEQEEAEIFLENKRKKDELVSEIKTILGSKKIGSLNLSQSDAQLFEQQLMSGENNKAYSQLDLEEQMIIDYLVLNKSKIKGLFQSKSKQSSEKKLDDLFKENTERKNSLKGSSSLVVSPLDADLSSLSKVNMKSLLGN